MSERLLVAGVDAGVTATGLALIELPVLELVESCCTSPPRSLAISRRLLIIHMFVRGILDRWKPDLVVIEESTSFGKRFGRKNIHRQYEAIGAVACAVRFKLADTKEVSCGVKLYPPDSMKKELRNEMLKKLLCPDVSDIGEHELDAAAVALQYCKKVLKRSELRSVLEVMKKSTRKRKGRNRKDG